jgi:hypothetical protein
MVSVTPRPLYPLERAPGTHWMGSWIYPRAGLDNVEKRQFLTLSGLELRPLGRPARSQSLYRLRYSGCTLVESVSYVPEWHVKQIIYLSVVYLTMLPILPYFPYFQKMKGAYDITFPSVCSSVPVNLFVCVSPYFLRRFWDHFAACLSPHVVARQRVVAKR